MPRTLVALLFTGVALVASAPRLAFAQQSYLFAWTGDGDRKLSDFLAVIDADPASKTYGHLVATLPVGSAATMPHHTEYDFPRDGILLANGWATSKTYIMDLRTPASPKVIGSFSSAGNYSFPHSFARLPNGHVLGTFQGTGKAYAPPGGLVELTMDGKLVRSASAAGAGLADTLTWPYSLAVDAAHDRVVTTNTSMPIPGWLVPPPGSWQKSRADSVVTNQVQVWRLSDLKLLSTISLPKPPGTGPKGREANLYAAEPRLLPDGSMYVNTFNCGLFHVTNLNTQPHVSLAYTFPLASEKYCAVPAIVGHYWIQTVSAIRGLVALDITNPDKPVEVSRLVLGPTFAMPHWLASDSRRSRVVVTGDDMGYVVIVNVDPHTGKLSLDDRFRDERTGAVGVSLNGRTYPQGTIAKAFVHGTLFGPR
jgi:56kDa selenium binding protein (SBP56)